MQRRGKEEYRRHPLSRGNGTALKPFQGDGREVRLRSTGVGTRKGFPSITLPGWLPVTTACG